jgi:hypothetical protein
MGHTCSGERTNWLQLAKRKQSGAEVKFSEWLRDFKVHHVWESQRLKYKISKTKIYISDFPVMKKNGEWMYLEVKGWFDPPSRQKMLYVIESNPGVDIRMVFVYDNKLNKNTETRYSDWCEKHNIKYTIGLKLPDEWLDELKTPRSKKYKEPK